MARQYVANLREGAVVGFKYFDLEKTARLSVTARGRGEGRLVVATDEGGADVIGLVGLQGLGCSWGSFSGALASRGEREALFLIVEGDVRVDLLGIELA